MCFADIARLQEALARIRRIADARGIPVIEDCAQAYLATQGGRLVGTLGAIGAFSLQQGKHMTTGEGGVVITSDAARARCLELVDALGMQPFAVADELRPLYHAAASAASNYIVTVASYAESLAATAGVDRALLLPLVRAATENWARLGPSALTGPVARGDEQTVMLQRQAVATHASASLPLWDALVAGTRELAAHNTVRNHEDMQ